jgi:hypothetical protein
MYARFEAEIEQLNQRVLEQAGQRPTAGLLMAHPGVGPIMALATDVFLGDPKRFTMARRWPVTSGSFPGISRLEQYLVFAHFLVKLDAVCTIFILCRVSRNVRGSAGCPLYKTRAPGRCGTQLRGRFPSGHMFPRLFILLSSSQFKYSQILQGTGDRSMRQSCC